MAEEIGRAPRPSLDRERVVRLALELLDEVGLDDLTMRRLADRLGVTAASLYWHVRDKDELLTLLADAISAEIPLPDPARPWRQELAVLADNARRVAHAHRDGARVLAATLPIGPQRLRAIEALLALLRRAGFRPQDAADAGYLLNIYLMGFVLDEVLSPRPAAGSSRADAPDIAAPLGRLRQGRLILPRGAASLTIHADSAMADLYRVRFEGRTPEVQVRDGVVQIAQRPGRRTSCDVTLNGAIPWEIQIERGVWRLSADLAHLRLAWLRLSGGANETTLRLPPPSGAVPLRLDGSVHKVRIERPPKAAISVHLNRNASRLSVDGMRLGAVGGGTRWESPTYATADDRYDLTLGGNANELTIITAEVAAGDGAAESAQVMQERVRHGLSSQPTDQFPNLVALADYLATPDQDRRFHVGLDIFLDGLERRLASGDEAPS